jgi:hypothetical protein
LKQAAEAEIPLELKSPCGRVRAELSVETAWIGTTVYPECPVWRAWYDDRPVVDTSTVGLADETGTLAYGMRFVKAERHRPQTGIGPARSVVARFAARDGRELEVTLRVTDLSAFCTVREVGRRPSRAHNERARGDDASVGRGAVRRLDERRDIGITRFPENAVLLGRGHAPDAERSTRNAEGEGPQVRFAPSGKLIAWWRHGVEQHVVFFDRPGDLAVRRFGAREKIDALPVADGRQGCEHLFLTVPFTKAELPAPVFGEALTPAYRAAFEMMLGRWTAPCGIAGGRPAAADKASDDFWMMRGEPGEFAIAARRRGGVWHVGGLVSEPMTLTVRFEDLWLRTPPELRALRYTVEILRDPIKDEPGDRVEESFAAQAPDVRVALDAARSGGFLLAFMPDV